MQKTRQIPCVRRGTPAGCGAQDKTPPNDHTLGGVLSEQETLAAGELQVLGHRLGQSSNVVGDGDGELDLVGLAEFVGPCQEVSGLGVVVGAGQLVQTIQEDVSDIEVACDEKVVSRYSTQDKKFYSLALL